MTKYWNGSAWAEVLGVATVPTLLASGALATSISTTPGALNTWTTETAGLVVSFVAPASGIVEIKHNANVTVGTTGATVAFGYKISGGATRDPNLYEALGGMVSATATVSNRAGCSFTLSGLTAGATYTLTSAVDRIAGSGAVVITDRWIHVTGMMQSIDPTSGDVGKTNVVLGNSWVAFSADLPNYLKRNGVVYLANGVKSGTNATVAFSLPSNCAPATARSFKPRGADATVVVDISVNGNVTITATDRSFIFLDGIIFTTAQ